MNEAFNIVNLFYEAAENNPSKTAIVYKNKIISFGELKNEVRKTAQYFIEKGIKKGDRVFVFVPMSIHLYRVVLALFAIGATAVFIDEWVGIKRMQECSRVAQCKAVIGVFKLRLLSYFLPGLREIPVKLGVTYRKVQLSKPIAETNQNDTALITFTTGSTGTPKAAKRTHRFLYHQFEALLNIIQPQPDDIDMPVLPIVLLINLGTGIPSVIANYKSGKPETLQPEEIIGQIKKHSVNRIIASPFFIKTIAGYLLQHKIGGSNIRRIFTGGAPVFPREALLFTQAFDKASINIVYGSTEAEPISSINANELKNEQANTHTKGLKAGAIDTHSEVKIIKMTNETISLASEEELINITLPPNETGEIIVSGDHVLTEYFNNENALQRNKIFIGDTCWHRTGDCGYIDEEGSLYLLGRCASLINKNGSYLSPFIYEDDFKNTAGVEAGTIILLNNQIAAVIEVNDNSKRASVNNQLKEKNPELDNVIFIKKMPKDLRHNSKIDYEKLIALLSKQR